MIANRRTTAFPTASATETPIPPPPEKLGEAGRVAWQQIVPRLFNEGRATVLDLAALESLCRCYDDIAAADAVLSDEGHYCETQRGGRTAHPALIERSRQQELLRKYLVQFGLTPVSRKHIPEARHAGVATRKR